MRMLDRIRNVVLGDVAQSSEDYPSAKDVLAAYVPAKDIPDGSNIPHMAADAVSRGDRQRDLRNWVEARSAYAEALALDPEMQPIWIQLGHAAKESGDLEAAESAYRKALDITPGDADGHLQLGHLLKLRGRVAQALEAYGTAVALDHRMTGAQAEIATLRAQLHAEGKELDLKLPVQSSILAVADRPAAAISEQLAEMIMLGDKHREKRQWSDAKGVYTEVLDIDPSLQAIWIQLGHTAKESGDPIAAEAAYRKAVELDPSDPEAYHHLAHLLKNQGRLASALDYFNHVVALGHKFTAAHSEVADLKARIGSDRKAKPADFTAKLFSAEAKKVPENTAAVVFEVSDLMSYFRGSRLPTGIQRVQMEVIKSVIESETADIHYSIVCFSPEAQFWMEIPSELFMMFCRLAVSSGDTSALDWTLLLDELDKILTSGELFRFPVGSMLLDLGTSWWQRNYFLNLRVAKSLFAIQYVPFVHDLIPVMTPEYCGADLRRDFVAWITGVLNHADFFLANSQATANDLRIVASKLGHSAPDVAVIKLNADFRRALSIAQSKDLGERATYFLSGHDLKKGDYVLCVATIEARKNHAAAFAVWLKLIKRHGAKNVPKLVCVGKDGWLNSTAYEMLRASEILKAHVLILHSISDVALAMLYQNSRCTIYPSFYEGWGLPVTEALCYGKIPVIPNVSSLPEAGEKFAEYFDIESEKDFLDAVERVIYDDAYRTAHEALIANEYSPRTWPDIADQIVRQLKTWAERDTRPPAERLAARDTRVAIKAETGVLHYLGANTVAILWAGLKNGEIFRNGRGWWWSETWGCWTKGGEPASIAFQLDDVANSKVLVYVGLRGFSSQESICTLKCEGARTTEILLAADRDQVAVLELDAAAEGERLVSVDIATTPSVDLAILTGGADKRVIGAGVSWFYVCKKDDVLARMAIVEALAIGDFWRLAQQPPAQVDFFLHT